MFANYVICVQRRTYKTRDKNKSNMSTDKSAAALRELAIKHFPTEHETERYTRLQKMRREELISDLTALISEKQVEYFEFAKWIGFESSRLYYRDLDEKWIRTIFIIDENPHEEYEEYTTDELFNYWKENEQC